MRRTEKEITDKKQIEAILNRVPVGRLGMADGDQPYVVPVLFGYENGVLYIHAATEGRKLDVLRANPRVCFEVDTDVELVPADKACGFGSKYRSVICFGTAAIAADPVSRKKGLDTVMRKCTGTGDWEYGDKALERVVMIKVTITAMTGKQSGFKE